MWYFLAWQERQNWPGGEVLCIVPSSSPPLSPLCIAAGGGARMETGAALPSQRWRGDMVGSMSQLWVNGTSETLCGAPELSQLAKG